MSRWGLTYKGAEIVEPAEWNALVDALNELDSRVVGGRAQFTGDGSTTSFAIPHGLGEVPMAVMVGKGSPGLPDIDHFTADATSITVVFRSPPPATSFYVWWIAVKTPSTLSV
jgi:hypothetical protein